MTDIVDYRPTATTCIALRAKPLRCKRAFIALTDFAVIRRRARKSVGSKAPTAQRDEPIPTGFRNVHLDGLVERAPIGDEPYTVVKRAGDYEYVSVPVFRTRNGKDFIYDIVEPRLNGPWDVFEGCDVWYPLPDGREQGFWILIRLARGVRP